MEGQQHNYLNVRNGVKQGGDLSQALLIDNMCG